MSDTKHNNSYKDSLKTTSLFGGVQLYNIIIAIIRSKFIAVLLGPMGIGVSGLYTTTISLINTFTSFGIGSSAVKNISEANSRDDIQRTNLVISIVKNLLWITGILGSIVCLVTSPWLSQITFGNKDYTIGFRILSLMLLFQQLTTGQTAILQGLHKYTYMAKASMIGSTIGLFITIPFYYFWRIKAIAPVMVLSSIVSLCLSTYYSRKVKINPTKVTFKEIKDEGKQMLIMGMMISLSGILTLASSYIIRIFISNQGGIDNVGLYNAGFAIVNTYVGMVFTAMATDYYPRLSEINNNSEKFNTLVNNQIEISILILAPIISFFIILIKYIIIILYSSKFSPIESMVYWAMFAMYFKAIGWALGFTFLAKADSKLFFMNELVANIYQLLLNLLLYKIWGLTGLGISFLIGYVAYALQVIFVCQWRYCIKLSHSTFIILLKQLPLSMLCLIIVMNCSVKLKYTLGIFMILISTYISYKELDEKIDITEILKKRFIKKHE